MVDPLFKKIMRNHTQMMLAFQKMVKFGTTKKKYFTYLGPTFYILVIILYGMKVVIYYSRLYSIQMVTLEVSKQTTDCLHFFIC